MMPLAFGHRAARYSFRNKLVEFQNYDNRLEPLVLLHEALVVCQLRSGYPTKLLAPRLISFVADPSRPERLGKIRTISPIEFHLS